jgi:hypothetical protein
MTFIQLGCLEPVSSQGAVFYPVTAVFYPVT